jgi:hypothetical protein
LTDRDIHNKAAWDEKYTALLQRLEDYQEEKDNPRKQVVDYEVDELSVLISLFLGFRVGLLG